MEFAWPKCQIQRVFGADVHRFGNGLSGERRTARVRHLDRAGHRGDAAFTYRVVGKEIMANKAWGPASRRMGKTVEDATVSGFLQQRHQLVQPNELQAS